MINRIGSKSAGVFGREKPLVEKKITHIFLQDKHLKSVVRCLHIYYFDLRLFNIYIFKT